MHEAIKQSSKILLAVMIMGMLGAPAMAAKVPVPGAVVDPGPTPVTYGQWEATYRFPKLQEHKGQHYQYQYVHIVAFNQMSCENQLSSAANGLNVQVIEFCTFKPYA